MKLLILGQTVEDHIKTDNGEVVRAGGIFYSASAIYNFIEPEDDFRLCTAVNDESYEHFAFLYGRLDNKYIKRVDAVPVVHLNLSNGQHRCERYENITAKLEPEFDDNESFDGIYVNMITGFDIIYEDLAKLKERFSAPVYFDLHTLSRGLDENNNRFMRKVPDFDKWAENIDILQCNDLELKTICDYEDERRCAEFLFDKGIKIVIITKGENGAVMYKEEEFGTEKTSVKPIDIESVNKIGSGDVFGTIFLYSWLKSGSEFIALRNANIAAGIVTSYDELKKFNGLKHDVSSRID